MILTVTVCTLGAAGMFLIRPPHGLGFGQSDQSLPKTYRGRWTSAFVRHVVRVLDILEMLGELAGTRARGVVRRSWRLLMQGVKSSDLGLQGLETQFEVLSMRYAQDALLLGCLRLRGSCCLEHIHPVVQALQSRY